MKIGIISDSHGALDRLETALENLENGGIREIIHAGDFALGEIDQVLAKFPNINFRIAIGNCDVDQEKLERVQKLSNIELVELLEFELGKRKFSVAHKIADLRDSQAEILISGHTHIPFGKKVGKQLFLNPGSLQDDGGYFILETKNLAVERKLFHQKI